jgi:hypothetical protein
MVGGLGEMDIQIVNNLNVDYTALIARPQEKDPHGP